MLVHATSGIFHNKFAIVYLNKDNSFTGKHSIIAVQHERIFDMEEEEGGGGGAEVVVVMVLT